MKCPYCSSKNNWRMHKPLWLKFTPGKMDNMRCSDCGHEYIRWLAIFSIKHEKARRIVGVWRFLVLSISILLILLIVTMLLGN
mgnify:FL=1